MKAMSFQFVNYALTNGKMKDMAAGLSADQRAAVVSYVTGRDTTKTPDWTPNLKCTGARAAVELEGPDAATATHFGYDWRNTRKLTAKQAGLTTAQMGEMELAWAIAFPDASIMRSQGAIVGKNLFYPVAEAGKMYALDLSDPAKPCVQWVYSTPGEAPLRTSVAYGVLGDGTPLLVFSGIDSTVHAVDPRTGKALWTKPVGVYSHSMTTGTPSILKDRVIVPVAQFEISVAADNNHPCCTNHGYVLSLDPRTGAQHFVAEAANGGHEAFTIRPSCSLWHGHRLWLWVRRRCDLCRGGPTAREQQQKGRGKDKGNGFHGWVGFRDATQIKASLPAPGKPLLTAVSPNASTFRLHGRWRRWQASVHNRSR
jgi:hypothetical protein